MTERFRAADTLPTRDLWSDIVTREPGPPAPAPAGRRVFAGVVALVVMLIGIAIAVRAFHGSHPVVPAGVAANGKILLEAGSPTRIFVMNPDGSGRKVLRKLPANASSPEWSPDGTRIAFAIANASRQEIWIARADGSGAHMVFRCADHFSTSLCLDGFGGLTWSSDGKQIAVVFGALVVMNADGSNPRRLYTLPGTVTPSPAWSPDGLWIALSVTRARPPSEGLGPSTDLFLAAADGSGMHPLTNCGPVAEATCGPVWPSWSPDGKRIVFGDDHTYGIGTIDVDGTNLRTLVQPPLNPGVQRQRDLTPLWSPDGKQIVYVFNPGPGATPVVYEMGWDGSNPMSLHAGADFLFSWQRLPKG